MVLHSLKEKVEIARDYVGVASALLLLSPMLIKHWLSELRRED